MRKIWLRNKRKYALVDDKDYAWLSKKIWHMDNHGYAVRREWIRGGKGKHRSIKMHRLILGCAAGEEVDHINRKRHDNRRKNLRLATRHLQMHNRNLNKNNTSSFQGVSLVRSRLHQRYPWKAEIMINRKKINLGSFATAKEASKAYLKIKRKVLLT